MKKLVIALLAMVAMAGTANAGLYTTLRGLGSEQIQTKAFYTVNTVGEDPRVYEFSPKLAPKIHCIMVFTETARGGANQMECFKESEIK